MKLLDSTLGFLTLVFSTTVAAVYVVGGTQGGVNPGTGERPFRQEIGKLQASGPAWNLYILALQRFQQSDQAQQLSYYQVAGIHGYPNIPWDGVTGGEFSVGYCTHASILFPTWHRPYLALVERLLWENAKSIAATYPANIVAQYKAAAVTFRIPYWDWSVTPTMPNVVSQRTITINTPTGSRTIRNPLYNYTFHPQPSANDFPPGDGFSQFRSTVRYPDSNGNSRPNLINQQLTANGQGLHDMTYQLLSSQPNFGPFSNTAWSDSTGATYNSIENLHNAIHGLVGNGGHMGVVPYAAFDPIFWLHHANVDRLVAIWQALYPDSWVTPQADAYGTYTNEQGQVEDTSTPLTPFHSAPDGSLYNSDTARSTRTFGYTVPEVVDWNVSPSELATNVRATINSIYNPNGTLKPRSTRSPRSLHKRRTPSGTGADHQWVLNIRADKTQLPASLFIHFFISPPPPSPSLWSFDPSLIASQSLLVPPASAPRPAANLLSTANATAPVTATPLTHAQIPLTHALIPLLPDLQPNKVMHLLKQKLEWRGQGFDDAAIDPATLPQGAVHVEIASRTVRQRGGSQFPVYGPWRTWGRANLGSRGVDVF